MAHAPSPMMRTDRDTIDGAVRMRDVDSLFAEIRELPLEQRHELQARLETDLLAPLPESALREAKRRLALLRSGEDAGIALEDFLADLRSPGDLT